MAIERVNLNNLPGGMRNIYMKAQDLIRKKDYEYGAAMLKDLVKAVPGSWDARELLREAEKEKALKMAGFARITGMIKVKLLVFQGKLLLVKDSRKALDCAEEAVYSLYCEESLYFTYEVALAMDAQDLAIDSLERVFELNRDNEKIINELIGLLDGVPGHATRILQLRQKLVEKHPKDLKAQAALRAAAAAATMEQNAEKAAEAEKNKIATRDNGTNLPDMSDLERGDRFIRSEDDIKEMIRRYEQVVEAGKDSVDILRKLAEYYQRVNMHEKAIETFEKLSKKQGVQDITVDKAIEKSNVALANEHIQSMIDSGAPQADIDAAKASLQQYQIECGKQRIKNFPGDLQVRYEQGLLYFDMGQYDNALPEFQAAEQNPQRRQMAKTYIGRCFARNQQYDMAVDVFSSLAKEMPFMDTQKMRTLYYLGNTYELMNKPAEAYECYKQIYSVNINYKDVADKVKKHYELLKEQGANPVHPDEEKK